MDLFMGAAAEVVAAFVEHELFASVFTENGLGKEGQYFPWRAE